MIEVKNGKTIAVRGYLDARRSAARSQSASPSRRGRGRLRGCYPCRISFDDGQGTTSQGQDQSRPARRERQPVANHPGIAPLVGPDDPRRFTDSGIEIQRVYEEEDIAGLDLRERLGEPGEYPFTRGVQPKMYRSRRWTMRQYAGFSTAEETNRRYRYLLENGRPACRGV